MPERIRQGYIRVNRAVVSAVCEMVISVIDGKVDRIYDEGTGLNIFKFE